jgi:hypothetical protein
MQEKGRTCRACHDVHASNQEGRIRDSFPFGKMDITLYFSKTERGGSCLPGCHREKKYDRVHAVDNEWNIPAEEQLAKEGPVRESPVP